MAEDRRSGDPFSDPADPQAAAREQRRREREARRAERDEKQAGQGGGEAEAPPPAPAAEPPRSPEADFWDEEEEPLAEDEEEPFAEEEEAHWGGAAERPPEEPARRGRWGGGRRHGRGGGAPRRGAGAIAATRRHPLRVVGAILAILVLWFLYALFQPFHGNGSGRVAVRIPKGASVSEVGDLLDERGVVSSSLLFQIRATLAGKRSSLYPGRFVLAHDMSYGSAIDALSTPPLKRTATVTIPEGYSRAQAAPLAAEAGLTGSYLKETVHSKYLDPASYGGKGARNLEGFLFPDTFDLKAGAPVADLVQLQLQDFRRRIKGVDMSYARSKNLTVYDVLTIASMVQAESGVPAQDRLVAGVIYNRLREGIPLGIDATVRFATGNYDSPLTESELATDSPYNTRVNAGLPPGPIGNPGLEAIEAAARPSKAGYLYYVTKPGACNELVFAKTAAEFEADVARYNRAREEAGGNSPTTCGE
jgi:peptidoglycan lytic transglycosylase G